MHTTRRQAERDLDNQRRTAPLLQANRSRNARAEVGRRRRWAALRDRVWELLDGCVQPGARIAVLGAGNGDTLPLPQLAARSRELTLIDIDGDAIRRARRQIPRRRRGRVQTVVHDATVDAADAIVRSIAAGEVPQPPWMPEAPLPGAPYDLVVGDLFYSQLLYPALLDLSVPPPQIAATLDRYGPPLTRSLVSRMHASAPYGRVLHIHDPIGWWDRHPQPISLQHILRRADHDIDDALSAAAAANGPHHTDPRPALRHLDIPIRATRLWHWPFTPGVDYLACATLAGIPLPLAHTS